MIEPPHHLEEDVPLAPRTTLEVGGAARYLARVDGATDLRETLVWAREHRLATFVLGGGSNLLVADRGFDGLVVEVAEAGFDAADDGPDHVLVRAAAGLAWDELVAAAVDEGWGGLECLSGIPGRVGAAPIQNVGAYGQEVAETITAVLGVDRTTGEERVLAAADCGFAYRMSRFKGAWRDRFVVTAVDFRLRRGARGTLRYPDLERRFGTGAAPGLAEVRRAVLEVRRGKSMVLDPGDPNHRSAGSFFTNPLLPPADADAVARRLDAPDMPRFPSPDGRVKLSAAWLIERCGLGRGFRLGRAAISSRHSLALVNTGGARAADVVALAAHVRRTVRQAAGVTLEPEPVFLGFSADAGTLLDQAAGEGPV